MKSIKVVTIVVCSILINIYALGTNLKPYEQWWQSHVDNQMSNFQYWLGNEEAKSRVAARQHIKNKEYKSVLDVPSGLCVDYFGFKKDKTNIEYCGLDITPKLVERAKALGIPVIQGSIESMPFKDSLFDVCYARHILEHLEYYKKALNELIRVAKKEVLIIFFITPDELSERIDPGNVDGMTVYHNKYNRIDLEKHIILNSKVERIAWEKLGSESILHIYVR